MAKQKQQNKHRQWQLPDPALYKKGENQQSVDLHRRMSQYVNQHRDQFPGTRPLKAADKLYHDLTYQYVSIAQTLHPWSIATSFDHLPMIDFTEYDRKFWLPDGSGPNADEADLYNRRYNTLPYHIRLKPPVKGLTEFTLANKNTHENSVWELTYVKIMNPGIETQDYTLMRTIRIARYYKISDWFWQPNLIITADLQLGRKTEQAKDPCDNDMFSVHRDDDLGITDYLIAVPPSDLNWDEKSIQFWEEVVLPNACRGDVIMQEHKSNTAMIQCYSRVITMLLEAMTDPEATWIETEESSKEAKSRAFRPPYLKPNPDDDTRKSWRLGDFLYKAHAKPELDPEIQTWAADNQPTDPDI